METAIASGNIAPSVFVKQTTTADGKVTAAGTGGKCWGISQPGTRQFPIDGLDDGYAAIAGEPITVYTYPDKAKLLRIGSGGCTNGDRLKSDANSYGVTTTTNLDEYGAIARGTGIEGDLVPVDLVPSSQVSS